MRLSYIFLITYFFVSSIFAQSVKLYIRNHSNEPIIIEKINGVKMTIPPKGFIAVNSFTNHTEVKNYTHKKYTCSWYINKRPDNNIEMIGISYGHPNDKWTCISQFQERKSS